MDMTHLAVAIDLNCDLLETADDKLLNLERVLIAAVAHSSGLTLGQMALDSASGGILGARGERPGEGLECIGGQILYILPLPRFLGMLWHSGAGTGDAACRSAFAAARD